MRIGVIDMSLIDSDVTMYGLYQPVSTDAASDESLVSSASGRASWDQFIDNELLTWWQNPARFADDDFVPPSRDVIHLAIQLASFCRDQGYLPPTRVLPDGDGGISFERRAANVYEVFQVNPSLTIELLMFVDGRLALRKNIL